MLKKVLYIGWIGYKNLGDELMFDLFKERFLQLGEKYKLDTVNNEYRYLKNINVQPYDLVVLGGGSLLSGGQQMVLPYIIDFLHQALLLNKKILIWGSGIDWAPKEFIERLEKNREIPLPVSNDFKNKVKTVFEESVWAGVRGPLTYEILRRFGVSEKLHISGDPGFLMNLQDIRDDEKIVPDVRLTNHEKIVGVNWGTSYNNIYGKNEIAVENQLADALNQLTKQGYLVYLFTVWGADVESIQRLYHKLHDKESVIFDQKLYNHNELMSIMQHLTFTINFKLHASYISLAAQVPFVALGYRFKVFDFVKSVELDDYIISTDDQKLTEQLLHLEAEIGKHRETIVNKMKGYQSLYTDRVNLPFENKLYL